MKTMIPAAAALLVLGACATATPYQAAEGGKRGYADQQIEQNRWSISFSGNSLTDRQTVETYLLYRAAELTTQQGYDWFQVVTRETDEDTRFVSTGFSSPFFYSFYGYGFPHRGFHRTRFSRFGGFYGRGFYHDPFFHGPDTFREVTKYEATAEIILGRGEKPEEAAFFDAEDVLVNLSGAIRLPEA
ncbi:MAG: hypothetical protein AAFX03_05310 [Pseudomonadota bacterium]